MSEEAKVFHQICGGEVVAVPGGMFACLKCTCPVFRGEMVDEKGKRIPKEARR